MDFREATDRLPGAITLADIAAAAGVSDATIRRARLDPRSSAYRSPPSNWRDVLAELAEARARDLEKLARELRREPITNEADTDPATIAEKAEPE